jgi:two-component system cell cycle sensor histidine kinase/response regulator CckA
VRESRTSPARIDIAREEKIAAPVECATPAILLASRYSPTWKAGVVMNRPAYETARLELARLRLDSARSVDVTLGRAARVCSRTLGVERCGVWLFEDDFARLTCHTMYLRTEDRLTSGDVLDLRRFPIYSAALRERRAIVADDARTHPQTCELAATYLEPLGITSMLDAPLYRRGQVVGVVCYEHVGPRRAWTQADVEFAASVADLVSTIFEHSEALALDDELGRRAARQHDADRLESIGRVCAAVAHDFNNVLTMVSMVGQQLGKASAQPELGHALDNAVAVGQRLVAQLRSYCARSTDERTVAPVADVIDHLRPVVELLVRDVAQVTVTIAAPTAVAAISTGHLEQILLNLCLNARDAIATCGTIEIAVRDAGARVELAVRDDGDGIAPEVLPSVFEPYFTTKATGTGLGLATVRDLVRDAGGEVTVASELGHGTTFTVSLPRA